MIQIDDLYFNQVKSVLAYPMVDNVVLDDDHIKELALFPAMMQYFRKFPLEDYLEQSITGQVIIDFPDEFTYGVLDARVVNKGAGSSPAETSILQILASSNLSISRQNSYGIKGYNPNGLFQAQHSQRLYRNSLAKESTTIKTKVDPQRKRVICYSNISGVLNITWAKYSFDFDNILFQHKQDVVKLSQANLLYHLADVSDIIDDSNLEVTINSDALKSRADALREEVMGIWDEYQDVIVLSGN